MQKPKLKSVKDITLKGIKDALEYLLQYHFNQYLTTRQVQIFLLEVGVYKTEQLVKDYLEDIYMSNLDNPFRTYDRDYSIGLYKCRSYTNLKNMI